MTTPPNTFAYEVLDEQGHKSGLTLDLPSIHKQELWHEVVNAWIINPKGEILMQLRAPSVELAPNVWDVTIGTHVRAGEEPVMAGLRCLEDGLGQHVATEDMKHLFNLMCANPMPDGITHKVLGHVYLLQRDVDIATLSFDANVIAKFAWVPLMVLMSEVGSGEAKHNYFPRANNYYPQLFVAFQSWMK